MEKLSLIADFRKLEKELGKEPSDLLFHILTVREEMLFEQVATKSDLGELKSDLGELKSDFGELKSEFGELKSEFRELKSDFKGLRTEMLRDINKAVSDLRTDMANLAWKMGALFTVQVGVVVAIMKLL